jgi:hypothetical protein
MRASASWAGEVLSEGQATEILLLSSDFDTGACGPWQAITVKC